MLNDLAGTSIMTAAPRTLLADDHMMVAEGLNRLLADHCQMVGTVLDGTSLAPAANWYADMLGAAGGGSSAEIENLGFPPFLGTLLLPSARIYGYHPVHRFDAGRGVRQWQIFGLGARRL